MLKHYVFKIVIQVRKRGRDRPFDNKTLLKEDSETRWDMGHPCVVYLNGARCRAMSRLTAEGLNAQLRELKLQLWLGHVSCCV